MATKANPYKPDSKYAKVFDFIRNAGVFTREDVMNFAKENGIGPADVTVVLSPRLAEQCRGDCRGNMSAQGHLYFCEKLTKNKGEAQKYRFRWRAEEMEPHKREVTKTTKTTKATKKTAKKTAKKAKTTKKVAQTKSNKKVDKSDEVETNTEVTAPVVTENKDVTSDVSDSATENPNLDRGP